MMLTSKTCQKMNHRELLPPMMSSPYFYSQHFLFTPGTLAQKLVQESDYTSTGYWHHTFQSPGQTPLPGDWYLGLLEGRVVCSDTSLMSPKRLFAIVERYVPRLRLPAAKQELDFFQTQSSPGDQDHPLAYLLALLQDCFKGDLVHPEEVRRAFRLKLLDDLDNLLFDYGGQVRFLPASEIPQPLPILGFDLHEVLAEAHRRRLIWDQVKTYIPSSDSPLSLHEAAIRQAKLLPQQEQHLRMLFEHGNTVNTISASLAQDTLDIGKGLAQLVDKGLLNLQSIQQYQNPEIVIIDDSPLMLQQFRMLVSSWGYQVRSHADPTSALGVMAQSNPVAIFLDINMPELSGFDLLKQIRRQPTLANVPLIMLTAERTLSNNWRAQWSGCQFLSKPLTPAEIPKFKQELRVLLESIFPLEKV
jgi:CheY-like chemotaxis protein